MNTDHIVKYGFAVQHSPSVVDIENQTLQPIKNAEVWISIPKLCYSFNYKTIWLIMLLLLAGNCLHSSNRLLANAALTQSNSGSLNSTASLIKVTTESITHIAQNGFSNFTDYHDVITTQLPRGVENDDSRKQSTDMFHKNYIMEAFNKHSMQPKYINPQNSTAASKEIEYDGSEEQYEEEEEEEEEISNTTNNNLNISISDSTVSIESSNSTITQTANNTNSSSFEDIPQIPAYIRTTAMFFCIAIMILGVIGNVMVSVK